MVDRGELQAWKTPGGHRRITRASVQQWLETASATLLRRPPCSPAGSHRQRTPTLQPGKDANAPALRRPRVLLIEDSAHFQNLVRLLMAHNFPHVDPAAEDGFVGLAMATASCSPTCSW